MLKFKTSTNEITSSTFIQASFESFIKGTSTGEYGERFIGLSRLETDVLVSNFLKNNKTGFFTIESYDEAGVLETSLTNLTLINVSVDAIGKNFRVTLEQR